MAKSVTLPRRQPLLHYDSVDLPVVWNDWLKAASLLWSASPALQRVQDIFQPIIDVVHRETGTLDVQTYFNFEFVLLCIMYGRFSLPLKDYLMQSFAPRIPWCFVWRNPESQF